MIVLRSAGLPAALALLIAPTIARAETCYDLRAQKQQNDSLGQRITSANPGYTAAFLTCGAAGIQKYKETHDQDEAKMTGAACAATLCIPADSWTDCMSVNATLLMLAESNYDIIGRAREIGCDL